jgi:hypothetical protein
MITWDLRGYRLFSRISTVFMVTERSRSNGFMLTKRANFGKMRKS